MKLFWKRLLRSEAVLYLVAGVLTTAVNFVCFHGLDLGLSRSGLSVRMSYQIAYAAAFFAAVIFAYWTNKFFVFRNFRLEPFYLLREFSGFFAARLVSGLLTFVLLVGFIELLHFGHSLAWLSTTTVNLVFNYLASKFWIFKK